MLRLVIVSSLLVVTCRQTVAQSQEDNLVVDPNSEGGVPPQTYLQQNNQGAVNAIPTTILQQDHNSQLNAYPYDPEAEIIDPNFQGGPVLANYIPQPVSQDRTLQPQQQVFVNPYEYRVLQGPPAAGQPEPMPIQNVPSQQPQQEIPQHQPQQSPGQKAPVLPVIRVQSPLPIYGPPSLVSTVIQAPRVEYKPVAVHQPVAYPVVGVVQPSLPVFTTVGYKVVPHIIRVPTVRVQPLCTVYPYQKNIPGCALERALIPGKYHPEFLPPRVRTTPAPEILPGHVVSTPSLPPASTSGPAGVSPTGRPKQTSSDRLSNGNGNGAGSGTNSESDIDDYLSNTMLSDNESSQTRIV